MAKKKQSAQRSSNWRELTKGSGKSRKKTVAFSAKLRIFFERLKYVVLLFAACTLLYAGYVFFKYSFFEDVVSVGSQETKRIEFKTDGVITGKWVSQYVNIPKRTKLSDINIFEVKSMLKALSQVKTAEVERIYPDKLRITISEHRPMAKTIIKIDTRTVLYLISPEGVFYEPICLNDEYVKRLPLITSCNVVFDGRTPKNLKCAKKLEEFLAYTQAKLPMKRWARIDVRDLESIAPIITATSENGIKIIFAPTDYPKQFDRLEYVIRYSKENNKLQDIEQIDLSLKERADVRLRKNKK